MQHISSFLAKSASETAIPKLMLTQNKKKDSDSMNHIFAESYVDVEMLGLWHPDRFFDKLAFFCGTRVKSAWNRC